MRQCIGGVCRHNGSLLSHRKEGVAPGRQELHALKALCGRGQGVFKVHNQRIIVFVHQAFGQFFIQHVRKHDGHVVQSMGRFRSVRFRMGRV